MLYHPPILLPVFFTPLLLLRAPTLIACTRDMMGDLAMDWSSMVVKDGEDVSWKSPYDWSFLKMEARERRRGRDRERRGSSGGGPGGAEGQDYPAVGGNTGPGPSVTSPRATPKGKRKVAKKREGGRELARRAAAKAADAAAVEAAAVAAAEAAATEVAGGVAADGNPAGALNTGAAVADPAAPATGVVRNALLIAAAGVLGCANKEGNRESSQASARVPGVAAPPSSCSTGSTTGGGDGCVASAGGAVGSSQQPPSSPAVAGGPNGHVACENGVVSAPDDGKKPKVMNEQGRGSEGAPTPMVLEEIKGTPQELATKNGAGGTKEIDARSGASDIRHDDAQVCTASTEGGGGGGGGGGAALAVIASVAVAGRDAVGGVAATEGDSKGVAVVADGAVAGGKPLPGPVSPAGGTKGVSSERPRADGGAGGANVGVKAESSSAGGGYGGRTESKPLSVSTAGDGGIAAVVKSTAVTAEDSKATTDGGPTEVQPSQCSSDEPAQENGTVVGEGEGGVNGGAGRAKAKAETESEVAEANTATKDATPTIGAATVGVGSDNNGSAIANGEGHSPVATSIAGAVGAEAVGQNPGGDDGKSKGGEKMNKKGSEGGESRAAVAKVKKERKTGGTAGSPAASAANAGVSGTAKTEAEEGSVSTGVVAGAVGVDFLFLSSLRVSVVLAAWLPGCLHICGVECPFFKVASVRYPVFVFCSGLLAARFCKIDMLSPSASSASWSYTYSFRSIRPHAGMERHM